MSRRVLTILLLTIAAVAIGALMAWRTPRITSRATPRAAAAPSPVTPPPPGRKIKARLFYVADDGLRLTSVERDIAYGEGTVEQARQIVAAQIEPAVEPLVSAVPAGTALRAVFLTQSGDAYVDFSREIMTAHPGGTHNELLTIYTIVNALTVNLPAVTSVQVLVDGKEVDTLAGHIDLRQPLTKNLNWVVQ
jgi:sporulation and spore germination protein